MATTFSGQVTRVATVDGGVLVNLHDVGAAHGDSDGGWQYLDDTAPALGATVAVTIGAGSPTFSATVTSVALVDDDRVLVLTSLVLTGTNTFRYFCTLADAPELGDSVPVTIAA